jgi:hypothetical protein
MVMGAARAPQHTQAPTAGDTRVTNPHAEWFTPEEFGRPVEEFHGTRTLMFDKAMAEAVLAYNRLTGGTGGGGISR